MNEFRDDSQERRAPRSRKLGWRSGVTAVAVAGVTAAGAGVVLSQSSGEDRVTLAPATTEPRNQASEIPPTSGATSAEPTPQRTTSHYIEIENPNTSLVMGQKREDRTLQACGKLARTQILERGTSLPAAGSTGQAQVMLAPIPEIDRAVKDGYTSLGVAVTGETGETYECARFDRQLVVTPKSQRALGGVSLTSQAGYVSFVAWNPNGEARPIATGDAGLPPTRTGQAITPPEGDAAPTVGIPVV